LPLSGLRKPLIKLGNFEQLCLTKDNFIFC